MCEQESRKVQLVDLDRESIRTTSRADELFRV